jgi:hypothetical protein
VEYPWKFWGKSWVERHSVYSEKKCVVFFSIFRLILGRFW